MMHPQYTNQAPGGYGQGPPPPQGFGGPPSNIGQPPMQPPQMYNNGLNPQPNRPPGPGGYGMKQGMPPGAVTNGPGAGNPPAGFGSPAGGQYGGMAGGPPMKGPPGPSQPPHPNQLSNQMGAMQLSGPRPPTSMAGQPNSIGGPPNSMGGPPNSMGGPPNTMGGPPNSMVRPPNAMGGPPNLMSGQPNSMGGPPNSMGGPPNSMGGLPNAMGGPPNSMGGPPNSMGGPPNSMGGPPNSMGRSGPMTGIQTSMGAPQNSMASPPFSVAGPASTGSGNPPFAQPGVPPSSGFNQNMGSRPPMASCPGGMMPPSSGMMPQSSAGGAPPMGVGAPPTSIGAPLTNVTGMAPNIPGGGMNRPPFGAPATSMNQPGGPPASMPGYGMGGPPPMGAPPTSQAPPMGNMPPMPGAPPTSMAGGMPPNSMGGPNMGCPITGPPPMSSPFGMAPPPPSPGSMQPVNQGYGQRQVTGGAPPMSGRPPMPGPMPVQPQQQPRKLNPDDMPSPIQVIEDDKANKGVVFQTGQQGAVPPLVTTNILYEDQGNAIPRFIRSTMYNIPCTGDMLKQSQIPFCVTISPFAQLHPKEIPPPVVDLGDLGPVRCNRCKAYMCPNMLFVDGGRRFQCCFCGCSTEVPPEYFNHLDHTGRRVDCYDRPELSLGTYEFVATKDYCKNGKPPKPPAFIFMLDISFNSVKSGLVNLLCANMKEVLQNLPKETGVDHSNIRVGFVTYAKQLHFFNIKSSLARPQMMVVSDVQDVFVPLLDGFLVTLEESEFIIDSLMEQIPQMFGDSRETEIVLGPVIQAGMDALKSAECSGKLFIFHSSLPIADAPGKLKNRDDRKLLGSDKEKVLLMPQTNFYTKLGQECVAVGCSVDLFLFPNFYIDVASIGEVSRLTGGQIYRYMYFQADLDGQRFLEDLKNNVGRPIAFDTIMRVRTSTGIRPVDFLGNFYMSNTTDVELASVDCDKAVTLEIKHDDKLSEADGAYLQAAVLYTTIGGQRRLRVINLTFNCCNQLADLFRSCELDTLINQMAKSSIRATLNTTPKQVRESLMNQCAGILACYRKHCTSQSAPGQLILPECMKLLPVYTNCIIKSACLQGGTEILTDDRSYLMNLVNSMNAIDSNVFFYPRLLPLHDIEIESTSIPVAIRCSYERLKDNGVYLLENGLILYLWIGMNVNPEWVQNLFGVQSVAQIDIDKTQLQDLDNLVSKRIRGVIKKVRDERHRHMKLIIVRQRDKLEPVFQQYLMEDRGVNGSSSYVDFLCHIHKEIRNLIS